MNSKGVYIKRKLIIVFIPGILIAALFVFFSSKDKQCKKRLTVNEGLKQIAFSYYSSEHLLGNGSHAISTGFYLNYEKKTYKVTTKKFANPIPDGTPILIRFLPESPNCNEILWDSIVVYNDLRYEFINTSGKGYVMKIQSILPPTSPAPSL